MLHTSGFYESIDAAGSFSNITALVDARLFTQGDDLRVPNLNQVVLISAGIPSGGNERVRLSSPTLDELTRFEPSSLNGGADGDAEPGSPPALEDLRDSPLVLGVDEILQCEVDQNPTSAQASWCLLWFSDGPLASVSSRRGFTVRATSSNTLTADVLTQDTITLDENLPPGQYQAIGLRAQSAGMIMARYLFRTGNFFRPGVLGMDDINDIGSPIFRHGGLGVMGEFPFTQTPAIEALSISGDSSQVYHLDLVRISR